ncbi:MAG: tungstate ABC transporter substrate-binding protein WtpA [Candidatus Delongbacteria bacterium]|nr:tungstate ABC transporter substrate-binding protein WtpA [Candidatus Delongbacteria bacterium]MBN2835473.1 tungstate ABC transporter substrate-binding protein WtpA [Candidatus Delongbacteria bacterium]
MKKFFMLVVAMVLMLSFAVSAEDTKLMIFHAGSLAKPFKEMKEAFEAENSGVEVLLEAAGSRACARKITDQHRQADVMGSADESVIRSLLMPEYADYCLNFVSNEMVIMYNEKSKYADEINSDNWYEILLKNDTEYGHSEPNKDPCGYRALMTWQLAEKYYKVENLNNKLIEARPIKNIRPKETDLLAMLDAGELDYLFIYKSVAEQHHSKYVELPREINLGSFDLEEYYKTASVELDGKNPGEKITEYGAPMVYGITVPNNAEHKELGEKFVEFVLSDKGQAIMKKNGHPIIAPALTKEFDKLPENLKKLAKSI